MKLPLINIPTIYHVGTLQIEDRGKLHAVSHEGSWLSASLCPDAWTQIAKLGGQDTWEICRPDALYLDAYAMGVEVDVVYDWAESSGLIYEMAVHRVDYFDDEAQAWCVTYHTSKEEAQAELADVLEWASQEKRARVSEDSIWTLTQEGAQRAKQDVRLIREANDFALQFWVEDVLSAQMPQVVGVYWDERYEPSVLSAPRAAILPQALGAMQINRARYFDEDEELLERLTKTMLLTSSDLSSPYMFVTDCVRANGDSINAMKHDPSCQDLSYEEFVEALGEGAEQMLDDIFPDYASTKHMGLTLGTDRCVSFHASSYEGAPCLFVKHSAIEHVFQRRAFVDAPRFQFSRSIKPATKGS